MCKLFECYLDDVDFEEDESLVFFNGDGDPMPHSRPALYMICSDFFGSYVTAHPVSIRKAHRPLLRHRV